MTTQKEKEAQATNTKEEEPSFVNEIERLGEAKRRALNKRAKKVQARTNEANYDTVREIIRNWNSTELARLRTEINALLSLAEDHHDGLSADERFGLQAICDVLQRNGLEYASITMLEKHRHLAKFKIQYQTVNKFFHHAKLDKDQRRTLFKIGLKLLYANLAEMGIPVSAVTLMNHTHRLPSVINKAFPGYAESGLLRAIFWQHEKAEGYAESPVMKKQRVRNDRNSGATTTNV